MPLQRYFHLFFIALISLSAQHLTVKNYTILDGLPESKIYDCTQANNGNMWFATEGGLIEYDGAKWTYEKLLENDTISSSFRFLKRDEQMNLWAFPLNYGSKIMLNTNNKDWKVFEKFRLPDFRNTTAVAVSVTSEDTLITLSNNLSVVYLYHNGNLITIDEFNGNPFRVYDLDIYDKKIIICSDLGVLQYDIITDSLLTFFENKLFHGNAIISFQRSINKTGEEVLFFLTNHSLIRKMNGETKILLDDFDIHFSDSSLNYIFLKVIDNGLSYFGSRYTAYKFDFATKKLSEMTQDNGFTTEGATSVFIDYENNTWITSLRGINKIKHSSFINYTKSDGLMKNEVTAIDKFKNGPFALAHDQGFSILSENTVSLVPITRSSFFKIRSRIQQSFYDKNNDVIWFNSQNNGIGYLTKDLKIEWVIKNSPKETNDDFSFFIDTNNSIYYSKANGLYLKKGDSTYALLNNRQLNIRAIEEMDDSHLFLASRVGLYVFNKHNSELRLYKSNDESKNNINAIYKLTDDNWLVGTYDGLYVFDGTSLEKYTELNITTPIFFIEEEGDYLWLGTYSGAIRWNPATGYLKSFSRKDGLIGTETNRDAFYYYDNNVYIGTNKGLSVFATNIYNEDLSSIKPKIYFRTFQDRAGLKYGLKEKISLPPVRNELVIKYNSPSFIDEKSNEYTILVFDDNKNQIAVYKTPRTEYTLQNLDAGTYSVGIYVQNSNGISSDTLYSASIQIQLPFFQETWFIILLGFLSISITYSIYDYMLKNRYSRQLELKVKERTEQLQKSEASIRELTQRLFSAQEVEREKIARELHDNIAQDMALIKVGIENIIKTLNKKETNNYNWLSQKVVELTQYLRDMAFILHPNSIKQTGLVNSVQSLCNQYITQNKIEIEFYSNLSEGIDFGEDINTNIYRFIQEALNNIRKHSKTTNGIVILVLRQDTLIIRIEDDGIGFAADNTNPSEKKRTMGLKSMEERILFIGGKLTIKSAPGEGTKLKAVIPFTDINHFNSSANSDQVLGS